jgi:hypothetical protein
MAFPTTSILDSFGRSDENPVVGDWSSSAIGLAGMELASNRLKPIANTDSAAAWDIAQFGSGGTGIEIYGTMPLASFGTFQALLWHIQDYSDGTYDGYNAFIDHANNIVQIYKVAAGSGTQLGANISVSFADGDSVGIEHIEATGVITLYKKTGGTWSSVDTRTDSTYTSGYFVLYGSNAANDVWDDFGGGTIGGGGGSDVFIENSYPLTRGMKTATAAGLGGVLIE